MSKIKELVERFNQGKGGLSTPEQHQQSLRAQEQRERQARQDAVRAQRSLHLANLARSNLRERQRKESVHEQMEESGKLQARKRRSVAGGVDIPQQQREEMGAAAIEGSAAAAASAAPDASAGSSSSGSLPPRQPSKRFSFSFSFPGSKLANAATPSSNNTPEKKKEKEPEVQAYFRRPSFVNMQGPANFTDDSNNNNNAEKKENETSEKKKRDNLIQAKDETTINYFARLCSYLQDPSKEVFWTVCCEHIRSPLSRPNNPPIQDAVDAGVVGVMTNLLSTTTNEGLLYEVAWVLTNISCGNKQQTAAVVQSGCIPQLIKLQSHRNALVVWQTGWVLGNIAGDTRNCRDLLLEQNALEAVCDSLKPGASLNILRNGAWTISNFFRWTPLPKIDYVYLALPKICFLLQNLDLDLQSDCLWALSFISSGDHEYVAAVYNLSLHQAYLRALTSDAPYLITPTLRIINNLVSTLPAELDTFIDQDKILKPLRQALVKPNYKRGASLCMQFLSLVCEKGGKKHRPTLILSKLILDVLNITSIEPLRLDALWVIYYFSRESYKEDIAHLVMDGNAIPRLMQCAGSYLLTSQHTKVPAPSSSNAKSQQVTQRRIEAEGLALDSLTNILRAPNAADYYPIFRNCLEKDTSLKEIRKRAAKYARTLICCQKRLVPELSLPKEIWMLILSMNGDLGVSILLESESWNPILKI